jgi:hypothetical protein
MSQVVSFRPLNLRVSSAAASGVSFLSEVLQQGKKSRRLANKETHVG